MQLDVGVYESIWPVLIITTATYCSTGLFGRFGAADVVNAQKQTSRLNQLVTLTKSNSTTNLYSSLDAL